MLLKTKSFSKTVDGDEFEILAQKLIKSNQKKLALAVYSIKKYGEKRGWITIKQSNLIAVANRKVSEDKNQKKQFVPKVIRRPKSDTQSFNS